MLGYSVSELEDLMVELGQKSFKGRQLFKWLYNSLQFDFSEMSDLGLKLRNRLAEKCCFVGLEAVDVSISEDGAEKYLFRLSDGKYIESVLIPEKGKRTLCVSSQVGCPLDCKFCATGRMGFGRDLSAGEIVGQLLFMKQKYEEEAFQNIVFMGMGEPLLNYDNLIRAIEIISSEIGIALSAKRITVSTAGIVPGIYALADSELKVKLAISLNAATDQKRQKLMPVARSYDLNKLMKAAKYFADRKKKRVTFEYILFKGFNDSRQDALALADLISGIPCKINVLAYNPIKGLPYHRPSDDEVDEFGRYLYPRAPAVTIRKSRGLDIEAACGQLAAKSRQF